MADESSFIPRSSEAFATSWLVGLGIALFSLGLPVQSVRTNVSLYKLVEIPLISCSVPVYAESKSQNSLLWTKILWTQSLSLEQDDEVM